MLDPFWPQTLDKENYFDDFTVKCVKIIPLSHCVEYKLNLSMLGSDAIIELAVLQIKAWTKRYCLIHCMICNHEPMFCCDIPYLQYSFNGSGYSSKCFAGSSAALFGFQ